MMRAGWWCATRHAHWWAEPRRWTEGPEQRERGGYYDVCTRAVQTDHPNFFPRNTIRASADAVRVITPHAALFCNDVPAAESAPTRQRQTEPSRSELYTRNRRVCPRLARRALYPPQPPAGRAARHSARSARWTK